MAEKLASLRKNGVTSDINGDLLYENHSHTPTSGFTLSVDSSKYSKILVIVYMTDYSSPETPYYSAELEHNTTGSPARLGWSGDYYTNYRPFEWSNNTLTVGNGVQFWMNRGNTLNYDSIVIPVEIYGIK